MTDQASVLDAVLGEWAERWLYPELAVAIESGEHTSQVLASALAKGLARSPQGVQRTAQWLVDHEEFDVLDALQSASVLSADETTEVGELRAQANTRLETELRRDWTSLAERARRVGIELPIPPWLGRDENADDLHWGRARAQLEEERGRVDGIERARRRELEAQFEARRTGADSDEWAQAVADCIESGRFDAAKRLIEMGSAEVVARGPHEFEPLDVPRTRPRWSFPDAEVRLEELLSWLLHEKPPAAAGYMRWLPAEDDTPALDLVRAIRRLCDAVDHRSVLDFVMALHALIGSDSANHTAETRDGGVLTRIRFHGHGLPPVLPSSPEGVAAWIAPAGSPPPAGTEPDLWIMLGPGTSVRAADGEPPEGYAHLDLLCLVGLLLPSRAGAVPTQRQRAVNLLRSICSRLPVRRVIADPVPFRALSEHEVSWLLDLMGVSVDAVGQDLLRYETGGNPRLLTELLAQLVQGIKRPRAYMADVVAIDAVRRDEPLAQRMRRHLESILTDHTAAALFRTAALYYWERPGDLLTMEQLREDMAVLMVDPKHLAERLPEARASLSVHEENFPAALDRLSGAGLFAAAGSNSYQLPFNGIRDLVQVTDPARSRELALSAVIRMNDHVLKDPRLTAAGYGDQMISMIGHDVGNEITRLRDLLDEASRATSSDVTDVVRQALGHVRAFKPIGKRYADCMAEPRVQLVEPLLRGAQNRFSVDWGRLHLDPVVEIGGPMHVKVNDYVLTMVVGGFLRNAANATARPPFGRAQITVRAEGDWCVISIEDNGPGFAAAMPTGVSKRGNVLARQVIEEFYGGELAVLNDGTGPAGMPGAHVQISLPLCPRTTPATGEETAD